MDAEDSAVEGAGQAGARTAVLFVCTGNICRSPLAEGVFRVFADNAGLLDRIAVDSAGTHDSQCGEPPDPRAVAVARRRGYELPPHVARKIEVSDFARFDWIIAMDRYNLRLLEALRPPEYRGHLGLLLALGGGLDVVEVPDPYFGGPREFERVLDLVERGADALLGAIRERFAIGTT